jgi:hypothetical protein
MISHFGVNMKESIYGDKLSRETYVRPTDKSSFITGQRLSIEKQISHSINALINFDVNMLFFKELKTNFFNKTIDKFLADNQTFKQVFDLNVCKNHSGYYLMILDEYQQAYLGTASDIYERIIAHWTKQKEFDRLIFGGVENSRLSIDSFRPLDTTRIYVMKTKRTYSSEDNYINSILEKYLLNRTSGGILHLGLTEAISKRKIRDLKYPKTFKNIIISYEDQSQFKPIEAHEVYIHLHKDEPFSEVFSINGKYADYKVSKVSNEEYKVIEISRKYIDSKDLYKKRVKANRASYMREYQKSNRKTNE